MAEAQARLEGRDWSNNPSLGCRLVRDIRADFGVTCDKHDEELSAFCPEGVKQLVADASDALAALRRVRDVLKNKSRIIVSHPDDVEVVNVSDVLAALDGEG